MEPRLIWINLLVKLGVAAAVSSSLVRSVEFKSLLFREERSLRQKIYLVLWFGLPITVGAIQQPEEPQGRPFSST
jgi:two-component system LytT family sensor kinase